ncbi:MAG: DUF2158 domain-containing protein [Candidatus Dadabacteria bacterium]|nr:DUF2158 domain-containing protein [Candidatus Dadabacteria bacterium]
MESNNISVGAVVRLKSGGPAMTVSEIIDGGSTNPTSAQCVWFSSHETNYGVFPVEGLELLDK